MGSGELEKRSHSVRAQQSALQTAQPASRLRQHRPDAHRLISQTYSGLHSNSISKTDLKKRLESYE